MARLITISDNGGLSGFGSISIMEDTAEVLLEALADVLEVRLEWPSFTRPTHPAHSESGTVTVDAREY